MKNLPQLKKNIIFDTANNIVKTFLESDNMIKIGNKKRKTSSKIWKPKYC